LWAKYELTYKQITGKQKRTNNFRKDERLQNPVESSDYRGSGFDRGHLVPAADMRLNYISMSETFYMTNMSPQVPRFNQGIWQRIEDYTRQLVSKYGDAHIITAPLLKRDLPRTYNGITVPDWYYKIIYIPSKQVMLSFLIENKDHGKAKIQNYQVSVDDIEDLTGLDFFAELSDDLEKSLESQLIRL
jgi:endonuclease G, mitochondrial